FRRERSALRLPFLPPSHLYCRLPVFSLGMAKLSRSNPHAAGPALLAAIRRAGPLPRLLLAGGCLRAFRYSPPFVFAQDQVFLIVNLDFGTGVLTKQDAIPRLHIQGNDFPVLGLLAVAGGDHLTLLRLLFCRVGDDDATLDRFLFFDALDNQAVV